MKQKGFTLIELLVVIAIVGLLSVVTIISLNVARNRGKLAVTQNAFGMIRTNAEIFYSNNSGYVVAGKNVICGTHDGPTNCNYTSGGTSTPIPEADRDKIVFYYQPILDALDRAGNSSVNGLTAKANDNSWAVSSYLYGSQWWCVDSSGRTGSPLPAGGANTSRIVLFEGRYVCNGL